MGNDRGRKPVLGDTADDHIRLLKDQANVEGFFRWQEVARVARQANINMPCGSSHVEALWAEMESMLPGRTKFLEPRSFDMIMGIAYRHIY